MQIQLQQFYSVNDKHQSGGEMRSAVRLLGFSTYNCIYSRYKNKTNIKPDWLKLTD